MTWLALGSWIALYVVLALVFVLGLCRAAAEGDR